MKSNTSPSSHTRAKLYNCGGLISARWYVGYSYRNPNTGKLERFKVYEDLNQHKTFDGKKKAGKKLVQKVNRRLLDGYNPFSDKTILSQNIILTRTMGFTS